MNPKETDDIWWDGSSGKSFIRRSNDGMWMATIRGVDIRFETLEEAKAMATGWIEKRKKSDYWEEDDGDNARGEHYKSERYEYLEETEPDDPVAVVEDELLLADGRFERGVSYVMEELKPRDEDMIWVCDKFGEKRMYFRDRFKVQFEKAH